MRFTVTPDDLQFLDIGSGAESCRIALKTRAGSAPVVIWLGGFRSDMEASKAQAIDQWAAAQGRAFVRFDYSGHGVSGGSFADGTISRWLDEALAVIRTHGG